MHRSYDIPDHEMRYVLSTFVVVPQALARRVRQAPDDTGRGRRTVQYYRVLGQHMGIRDVPESFEGSPS